MSMHDEGFPKAVSDRLGREIDAKAIKGRDGAHGRQFSYIEGWFAIEQANAIFGFDGWSYEIMDLAQMGDGAAYKARVRVYAGGVWREDIGCCQGKGKGFEAHDMAMKGAVTDAVKRALRTFGAQFGNRLYGDPGAPHAQAVQRREPETEASAPIDLEQKRLERLQAPAQIAASFRAMGRDLARTEDKAQVDDLVKAAKAWIEQAEKQAPHLLASFRQMVAARRAELEERASC